MDDTPEVLVTSKAVPERLDASVTEATLPSFLLDSLDNNERRVAYAVFRHGLNSDTIYLFGTRWVRATDEADYNSNRQFLTIHRRVRFIFAEGELCLLDDE